METRILTLFTRTPLHVGAGSSVGAVDQPIVRERHTRFPVIPGSSLKGVLRDLWTAAASSEDTPWLFGSEDAKNASAGALLVGEGRLLAFPIRSAKGCFAWITCPMLLRRSLRDGALSGVDATSIPDIEDSAVLCQPDAAVADGDRVMLEEYVLDRADDLPDGLSPAVERLGVADPLWHGAVSRLALVSDGMMSFFCASACEVAQHVTINDATGTASDHLLFNQENVPAETLFYSVIHAQDGKGAFFGVAERAAAAAVGALRRQLAASAMLLQIGADESTGLGWCSTALMEVK